LSIEFEQFLYFLVISAFFFVFIYPGLHEHITKFSKNVEGGEVSQVTSQEEVDQPVQADITKPEGQQEEDVTEGDQEENFTLDGVGESLQDSVGNAVEAVKEMKDTIQSGFSEPIDLMKKLYKILESTNESDEEEKTEMNQEEGEVEDSQEDGYDTPDLKILTPAPSLQDTPVDSPRIKATFKHIVRSIDPTSEVLNIDEDKSGPYDSTLHKPFESLFDEIDRVDPTFEFPDKARDNVSSGRNEDEVPVTPYRELPEQSNKDESKDHLSKVFEPTEFHPLQQREPNIC